MCGLQVFTFGSVPLKTYLPDGDIDLSAFSNNPSLKDSWASEVVNLLETEEKNENAEFHVKEVQYIQAEVRLSFQCFIYYSISIYSTPVSISISLYNHQTEGFTPMIS